MSEKELLERSCAHHQKFANAHLAAAKRHSALGDNAKVLKALKALVGHCKAESLGAAAQAAADAILHRSIAEDQAALARIHQEIAGECMARAGEIDKAAKVEASAAQISTRYEDML
jgi:hypothetical protein